MKYKVGDQIRKHNDAVRVLGELEPIPQPDSTGKILQVFSSHNKPYFVQWDGGSLQSECYEFELHSF